LGKGHDRYQLGYYNPKADINHYYICPRIKQANNLKAGCNNRCSAKTGSATQACRKL
jgi:hypothetical protein